jgi:hypothetical protein
MQKGEGAGERGMQVRVPPREVEQVEDQPTGSPLLRRGG